jgi:hypothetical protein
MSEQLLVTGVSVSCLIALIARLWFLQVRADSATAAAQRTDGEVDNSWHESNGDETEYWISVRFTTNSGRIVYFSDRPNYLATTGDSVAVIYDLEDPDGAQLLASRRFRVTLPEVSLAIWIVVFAVVSLISLTR